MGLEFYEKIDIRDYAREAARIAATMIDADFCPSGQFPVIIDNEFGGVIFHEACGHSLEATSVAKKTSVFADKLGQQIASELVTAYDDGTIPNAWGSANIDDEGTPTQRTLLIEKGILKGYLVDKLNGRRMGMPSTGSGRRQSYRYAPTSRMSNTFIAAGNSTPEDHRQHRVRHICQVNGRRFRQPRHRGFQFRRQRRLPCRKRQNYQAVRGATLIRRGSEILKKIDMVANNLALGQGMCLSQQLHPANVGQPMIRVAEITVGGRKGESNGFDGIQDLVFRKGRAAGFTDMELFQQSSGNLSIKVFQGEVDSYTLAEDRGYSFRGKYKGHMGYAYTEILDAESADRLVRDARENAEVIDEEEQPEIFAGSPGYQAVAGIRPGLRDVTPQQMIELAKAMEAKALAMDPRVRAVNYCLLAAGDSQVSIINTKGLDLQHRANSAIAYLSAVVSQDDDTKTFGNFAVIDDFVTFDVDALAGRCRKPWPCWALSRCPRAVTR